MNVRILARWEDDPLESPITLDAILDPATRRIVGRWKLFGCAGLGTSRVRPFVLEADGRMDFGEGRADEDRYWRADIRARDITLGATFEVIWCGGERGRYRIEKIAEPGSKTGGE